jgi:hypothetical protein
MIIMKVTLIKKKTNDNDCDNNYYFCSSNGIKVTIIMKQWYNTNGNINSGDVSIVIITIIIILTIIL